LEIHKHTAGGVVVFRCHGRILVGSDCNAFLTAVRPQIDVTPDVVLNLGGVNYIDSAGIGAIVRLYTAAQVAGGRLRISNLTPRVFDLLHISMVLTVIEAYATEEEAVAA